MIFILKVLFGLTLKLMCVYKLFPKFCEKKLLHWHITRVGFKLSTFAIPE